MIQPGLTIGILGTGQLGRMIALAAAELGYRCRIYGPEHDGPATHVAPSTCATFTDTAALEKFAKSVDVITYEFENIPYAPIAALSGIVPIRPSPNVLRISQDRIHEKTFVSNLGIGTAKFCEIHNTLDLQQALMTLGRPSVLKTAIMGYDGKGQAVIKTETDPNVAWDSLCTNRAILEQFVDFTCEISVIIARGIDGQKLSYVPVQNIHKDGILDRTIVPAAIPPDIAVQAKEIANCIADALDLVGVAAVEMFVVGNKVLVNEIAPRPHNSGHWTIDACRVSQFEQTVRAICELPLGIPDRQCDAEMKNLIGDDVKQWSTLIANPQVRLHLYGKAEARQGRKMGHITKLINYNS